jgi:DNA-binding LacI/PurR family transcriptional regulator
VSAKENVVNLRTVADRVGLAPCSVSAILNHTPAAQAIPKRTQDRVFRAAAELNYQPNFSARSLRTKRTHMIALLSRDFARRDVGHLVSRIERNLRERGYLLVLGSLDDSAEWPRLSILLRQRGVEGLIAVHIPTPRELALPAVSVHVGHVSDKEAFGDSACLTELADSAIDALLQNIERGVPGKMHVFSTPATGYAPAENPTLAVSAELV